MLVDAAAVNAYQRDGAVVLRGFLTPAEVGLLQDGIDAAMREPSARAKVASDAGDPGFFWEDFCRWRDVASLQSFVRGVPGADLGRAAAALLGSSTVRVFHDHILVKEPRTEARTPWHQDQPYYDVDGAQGLSFWIPVDPVPEETSLEVAAGTHRGPWLLPRAFAAGGAARWFPEGSLPEVAPAYGSSDGRGVLRWAMAPGDVLAFSFLAVHGAPGVAGSGRRRAFSLRVLGDDMRWAPRAWAPSPDLSPVLGSPDPRTPGAPLTGDWFPLLYERAADGPAAATTTAAEARADTAGANESPTVPWAGAYQQTEDSTAPPLEPPAAAAFTTAAALVDLRAYPLDALGTPAGEACVARLRAEFCADGAVVLPGFLRPAALAAMAQQVGAVADRAFVSSRGHNVYLDAGDASLPPEHPRNRCVRTVVGSVAYDDLEPPVLPAATAGAAGGGGHDSKQRSLLRLLYEWPPLLEFVRRILGRPALHRLADPIGACTVNVFRPGDEQGWHFDESEFSTTLMLAAADAGGQFDYAPGIRRPDGSEATTTVAALLDGDAMAAAALRRLRLEPGALAVFGGRTALHRVTRVEGAATRLVAVLTFCEAPGVGNSEDVRELFWGRRQP